MSYIANKTRVSSLTIGGVDYTSAFQEFTVSDQSAFKNGCLQTTGTLLLGSYSGGPLIEDYDRDNFKRGVQVILELTEPGGSSYRHPRGFLYVVSSSYDIQAEQLQVELGCRLTMMALTEKIDELVLLLPIPLDIAQSSYSNCSASFASAGKYVYQDNTGGLQVGTFFDGDSYTSVAEGEWVSILGVTSLAVQPLQGGAAIPDQISLSYQVPASGLNEDNKGLVETVQTDSYYFTNYPATYYIRTNSDATPSNPNGTLGNVSNTSSQASSAANSSPCGNTPDAPVGSDAPTSCNEGYELQASALFLPAFRRDIRTTTYDGPGAQVSITKNEVRGPAIEANGQYYADKYAYCRNTWATRCNPNGNCPYDGMDEILLGIASTVNYYGEANELIRTVTDVYRTTLSAAQPSDWRSGNTNGVPQDFNQSLSTSTMYRATRTDARYYKSGNSNIQEITSYASMTTRGVGIGGKLDALDGIQTREVRRSSTNTTVELAPDIANSSTTNTEEVKTNITLFTSRYKAMPEEVGPYILEEQIPVPLLFETDAEIDSVVNSYEDYIQRFVKGDAFGLQIAEAMRSDVVTGWRPGMPFRYFDTSKDKLIAFRMDATSWGVSATESAFVTNGVWIGFSDGTVVIPSNIKGNSRPDMGGGTLPPSAIVLPSIEDENSVDSGSFSWTVDVFFNTSINMVAYGNDGVLPSPPEPETAQHYQAMTSFVEGLIVAPGDLLATTTGGSIPLDANGSLVIADATVVTADLFD